MTLPFGLMAARFHVTGVDNRGLGVFCLPGNGLFFVFFLHDLTSCRDYCFLKQIFLPKTT